MNAEATPTSKARKSPRVRKDYGAIAHAFEDDVLEGRFPASRNFRAAIERQRRDLAQPPAGFVFDAQEADRWLRLMEMFPFSEGPRRGEPFELQPWQVWAWHTYFGWYDAVTRYPRFTTASVWIGKGNGKSPMAALVGSAILARDKRGGKLFSAASAQKQARVVLDHAREMLRLAPKVREKFGLTVRQHDIVGDGDPRSYEAVSREADTVEGIRPECGVILDEVHVLGGRELYDNLQSAINKTDGARFIQISTAGMTMDPQDIGYQLHTRAVDILHGRIQDDRTFALVVDADPELDAFSEDAIRQANPNLSISVSLAGLMAAAKRAKEVPSERASYEVKHLNRYQSSGRSFIDVRRWAALAANISLEDLAAEKERPWTVFVGLDLARTRDLTAAVYCAVRFREDGKREYRVFTRRVYLPSESITVSQNDAVPVWDREGWLTLIPGPTMDYGVVKRDIISDCRAINQPHAEVCVDEWSAAEVEKDLETAGFVVVAVKQGAREQSEPMKALEAAILDGRLQHDGSPVAQWCIGNLIAESCPNDSIRPMRESEFKKIDIAVALVNAFKRASIADLAAPSAKVGFLWIE